MNAKSKIALSLVLMACLASAAWAQAGWSQSEPIKIRVKTDTAVLRLTPSARGEVVADKVAAGTVMEAVRKAGSWYEVRHVSQIGMAVTAYIHKSDVEVVGGPAAPAAAPKPAKAPKPKVERAPAAAVPGKGLELSLGGGMALPGFKSWSDAYEDSFSFGVLQYANVTESLALEAKSPLAAGLSAAYFFTPRAGVKLRLDFRTAQGYKNASTILDLQWKWMSSSTVYTQIDSWPLTGEVGAIPVLSLDGVFRAVATPKLTVAVEGGISLLPAKISASGSIGYVTSWISGFTQYFDYFAIPIQAEASSTGIGFNAGLSGEYRVSPKIGIFAEALYVIGGKLTAEWSAAAGSYASNINSGWTLNFSAENAAEAAGLISPLEAALSFFKIGAGVRIRL